MLGLNRKAETCHQAQEQTSKVPNDANKNLKGAVRSTAALRCGLQTAETPHSFGATETPALVVEFVRKGSRPGFCFEMT